MPWQIYADYLEDKGSDTRLFRVSEPFFHIDIIDPNTISVVGNGNGWGMGYNVGFITGDGDGSEYWIFAVDRDGNGGAGIYEYSLISLAYPGDGGSYWP